MVYAAIARQMTAALGFALISTPSLAGGYDGGSQPAPRSRRRKRRRYLSYADHYADGDFRVQHTEAAGALASTGEDGETGYGYGSSNTEIETSSGVKSWKRSVQRSSGYAEDRRGERHRLFRQLRQGPHGRRQILHL